MKSIIGRKIGMTSVFDKTGLMIPVSVVEVLPNVFFSRELRKEMAMKLFKSDTKTRSLKEPLRANWASLRKPTLSLITYIVN